MQAVDARRKQRPLILVGDLNTELGHIGSQCNDDFNALQADSPAAPHIVDFLYKNKMFCHAQTENSTVATVLHTSIIYMVCGELFMLVCLMGGEPQSLLRMLI